MRSGIGCHAYKCDTRYVYKMFAHTLLSVMSQAPVQIVAPLYKLIARPDFDFSTIWNSISADKQEKLNVLRQHSFPVRFRKHPRNDVYWLDIKSAYWLDIQSGYSLTKSGVALLQADITCHHARSCGLTISEATITDATASIGGNVFAFATCFGKVNAIEKVEPTAQMLLHNLQLSGLSSNVTVWCGDSSKVALVADKMKQDVVFLDPPWGGLEYIKEDSLSLFLEEKNLRQICIEWALHAKLIVLKLPLNFNYIEFRVAEATLPFVVVYTGTIGTNRDNQICSSGHTAMYPVRLKHEIMDIMVLRVK